MSNLVISCSLSPKSRSRILAQYVKEEFRRQDKSVEYVDLCDHPLPLCDGGGSYDNDQVRFLAQKIEDSDAVVIATPIYNYTVNSAVKTLMEHVGRKMSHKVVGFCCAAGGSGSYMALGSTMNSLMFDFHCLIAPRFVYCTEASFNEDGTIDPGVGDRVSEFVTLVDNLGQYYSRVQTSNRKV